MDTVEAIYARRSVKHFDSNHALTAAEEQKLLQAAIQAPTSFNVQHWRFVVLRDRALRQKIREQLLEYCKLDTWGMVMIWLKLCSIAEKD